MKKGASVRKKWIKREKENKGESVIEMREKLPNEVCTTEVVYERVNKKKKKKKNSNEKKNLSFLITTGSEK